MTRERAAAKIDSAQSFVTASYFFGWQTVIFLDESFSISARIKHNSLSKFSFPKKKIVAKRPRQIGDCSIIYSIEMNMSKNTMLGKWSLSIGEITDPLTPESYRGKHKVSVRKF